MLEMYDNLQLITKCNESKTRATHNKQLHRYQKNVRTKKKTGNKQKLFEKYIHIKLVIFYY